MVWKPVISSINEVKINGYVPHTDVTEDGIVFSVVVPEGKKASLLLYEKGSRKVRCEIPFPEEMCLGHVYAMRVSGIPWEKLEYNYKIGGEVITDPAAQIVSGLERFGVKRGQDPHGVRGGFLSQDFDWEGEKPLRIPYRESIFYELHVRGFTKTRSSKVRHKGTFLGLTEKIPYLKELGITAVVLMPCYEHDEIMEEDPRAGWRPEGLRELVAGTALPVSAIEKPVKGGEEKAEKAEAAKEDQQKEISGNEGDPESPADQNAEQPSENLNAEESSGIPNAEASAKGIETGGGKTDPSKSPGYRVNYWGFGPGWFFAPKRSYSASADPGNEMRSMVHEMHKAGIEVILEMAFPEGTDPAYMQAVLLWWAQRYHIDGFLLYASKDDLIAVAKSPALSDVKLITDYFPTARMYPQGRPFTFRNLAECNLGFRQDARRLLKGDHDRLTDFVQRTRANPKDSAVINAMTSHDGFTMMDLVSYNDKHNEENGEQNHDGAVTEYSWNCGTEGPTKKKECLKIRMRQIRNAFAMMLLSQGTPMLLAGDEMGNSQDGNSNAWCYDNEKTWIDWSGSKNKSELFDFVKRLIAFRKAHPLLHQEKELTGKNAGGFFPDVSCHGANAWFASFDPEERSVGMMYCGRENPEGDAEAASDGEGGGSFVYCAYNFHWETRQLALPYLPQGRQWHVEIDTFEENGNVSEDLGREGAEVKSILVPGRSILVLVG